MPRARHLVLPVLLGVVVLAVLFTTVFPTRTWMAQRDTLAEGNAEIAVLEAEVAELEQSVDDLRDPAEIEKIARRDFGLVKPGEQVFSVLPPAPVPADLPPGWPFNVLAGQLD
jgi:cell division protein FtsL